MPVKRLNVGITEITLVEANEKRSVIVIANADASNNVFISDEQGKGVEGFIIMTRSYISMDRGEGFQPEKKYWVIAEGADTRVHVLEQFQKFKELEPEEDIQEPGKPDPRM